MKNTKEIRKELKAALGYNSRMVSVKSDYNSITFTIYSKNVDIQAVEKFAAQYKNVRYCEVSGEILSGGNTYTYVYLSENLKKEVGVIYVDVIKNAIDNIENETMLASIEGTPFCVGRDGDWRVSLWNDGFIYSFGKDDCESISVEIWKQLNYEHFGHIQFESEEIVVDNSTEELVTEMEVYTIFRQGKKIDTIEVKHGESVSNAVINQYPALGYNFSFKKAQ